MEKFDLNKFIIKDYEREKHNDEEILLAKVKLLILDCPAGNNYLNLDGRWANPIIVSETEQYRIGDNVYYHGELIRNVPGLIKGIGVLKVLALPEMFSSKQREAIYGSRLVNNEELYLQCEGYMDFYYPSESYVTFLNLNNHIRLFKINPNKFLRF